jgi:predicted GNAT family acetyltransferase
MATEVRITREDGPKRGRYVAKVDGVEGEGELVYHHAGEKVISADHTGVPDAFRGMGVGRALVERLVADARAEGFKILARCPYVKAEWGKHPEWNDLFKG